MRITRLEIFGFKSFVDRFVLNLDHSIVGIVGPNGCGKSNIVDALRWVLGETQAKQLRGSILEDLIFNGSDSRRALGMAEVCITIKPDDGWVKRANNHLKEIKDSTDAISGIKENNENLNNGFLENPENDVSKKKVFSFKDTALALEEIPGLFEASEIQLKRRLYRSGESEYFINKVPCRLADMVEFYRLIGLGARGLSIVQQGKISEIITKKPIERRDLLEESAGISGFRARIESAKRKLDKTIQNLERLSDIILEVQKQTRSLKRQANKAKRRFELKKNLEEAEVSLFKLRILKLDREYEGLFGKLEEINLNVSEVKELEEKSISGKKSLNEKIESLDEVILSLREKRNVVYSKIEEGRSSFRELSDSLNRAENEKRRKEDRISFFDKRKEEIEEEIGNILKSISGLNLELEKVSDIQKNLELELEKVKEEVASSTFKDSSFVKNKKDEIRKLEEIISKLPFLNENIKESRLKLREVREGHKNGLNELHKIELSIAKKNSELSSINSHLKNMALEVSRLSEGREIKEDLKEAKGEVLISGVKVDREIQTALNAVLGEKSKYLVCNNFKELLLKFEESKNKKNREKRSFGIIDSNIVKGRSVVLTKEEKEKAPSSKMLLELLEVEPRFEGVINTLIGNVVYVESLKEGIALQALRKEDLDLEKIVVVTKDGEVVTSWGWYVFGGKGLELGFARKKEDLKREIFSLDRELKERKTLIESYDLSISEIEKELVSLEEKKSKCLSSKDILNSILSSIRKEERRAREESLKKERDAQSKVLQITKQKTEIEVKLKGEENRKRELELENQSILDKQKREKSELEEIVEKYKICVSSLENFKNSLAESGDLNDLESEYREVQSLLDAKEKERGELNKEATSLSYVVEEKRRRRENLLEEYRKLELLIEKIEVKKKFLLEDILKNYPNTLMPEREESEGLIRELGDELEIKLNGFFKEASSLRARLQREGEVNPESIEQYEIEKKRLDNMLIQEGDLKAAKEVLDKTIKSLQDISKAKFLDTFYEVKKTFSELIPRLFGGGAGHLELVNEEDPLSSGVQLIIRPPGKKLKSIELLSGGEKALAATAMLFSVFLHRPSPICVLDEVDAPLDDLNLDRFLSLVKSISKNTQFLMITHNKLSMAASDRLVGITMEESGVTKALSVSFKEAEESIEKWVSNA